MPFYYFVKAALGGFVKTPVGVSLAGLLQSFIQFDGMPSAPLWFFATLLTLMLPYPLYRWLCAKPVRGAVFLVFAIAAAFIDLSAWSEYEVF